MLPLARPGSLFNRESRTPSSLHPIQDWTGTKVGVFTLVCPA